MRSPLLLLLAAVPSSARRARRRRDSVFLDELTWTELAARDRAPARRRSSFRSAAPSRTARTWRSASTTCASQALAEKIARALGNALVAPVIAYVPEGSVDPPTGAHALSRHDHACPTPTFEQVLESAARSFKRARLSRHRVPRRPRRLPEQRAGRRGAGSTANGRRTPVRVHAMPEYYRVSRDAVSRRRSQARGYHATPRSARTPASPTRRSRWRSIRALVRATQLASARRPTAADGVYGDPRRASAELGATRRRRYRRARPSPRSARDRAPLTTRRMSRQSPVNAKPPILARACSRRASLRSLPRWRLRSRMSPRLAAPRKRATPQRRAGDRDRARHAAGRRSRQSLQRDGGRAS